MRGTHTGALLAASISVLMLTGAAAPEAALTYHGVITAGSVEGSTYPCVPGDWNGIWNVRIPDRTGGVAMVFMSLKRDGRMDALVQKEFTLDGSADEVSFAASTTMQVTDHLRVTLANGVFTYVLDSEFLQCEATFTGNAVP